MSRRLTNKRYIDSVKANPCMDCGLSFPTDAMDFDHVRGIKIANISEMLNAARDVLAAELNKTELVCSNCHRMREMYRRLDQHVDAAEDFDAINLDDD